MEFICISETKPCMISGRGLSAIRTRRKGFGWLFTIALVLFTKIEKR